MSPTDSAGPEPRVVQVVLERGPLRPLDYLCPEGLEAVPGMLVRAPFRRTVSLGLVVSQRPPEVAIERLRPIAELIGPTLPEPQEAVQLVQLLRQRYLATWPQAAQPLLPSARGFLPEAARWEIAAGRAAEADLLLRRAPRQKAAYDALRGGPRPLQAAIWRPLLEKGLIVRHQASRPARPESTGPALTAAQAAALEALRRKPGGAFLLHGVTGSGKTEIYFRLIEDALLSQRGAILLVPEIALSAQLVDLVQARFGRRAAVIHSAVGESARRQALQRLRQGIADVVVGPRSAIFAPVDAGVVIMDEQHEASYQQDEAPRYHAQDVAFLRAARSGATLVLGSATPDLVTYHAARSGALQLVQLPERIGGRPLPKVHVADLRRTPGRIFSPDLQQLVSESVSRGEQAILLLNRRGFHPSMVCQSCGQVPSCPDCSVALAYHEDGDAVCHLCGHRRRAPGTCPACGGRMRLLGTGTQRVAQAARETWPGARILRLDRDAVRNVGAADEVYRAFRDGEADILVGTQMVAKGFDFPHVTAVGVVVADIGLGQPDFRASERTFQLLMQVSGRAGRADTPGQAVIQTFDPEHPAIRFAVRHDYEGFAAQELRERERGGYPPFGELLLIGYSGREEAAVAALAEQRTRELRKRASDGVRVLGPVPAPIYRAQGRYRWQTLLLAARREALRRLAAELPQGDGDLRETPLFDPRQFR